MRHTFRSVLFVCLLAALFSASFALRATSVLTYHYDSVNSGVNSTETVLNPSNVNYTTFSKLYSTAVDGAVYAQPLYVPSVVVTGGPQAGTHNLVIVATQHDSLYAIDSNSGVVVWQTTFVASGLPGATTITSVPSGDVGTSDTAPEIGICGTPVIDPATNRLYVAAKTKQILNGNTTLPNYVYTLYAVDITNGNATPNANILNSYVIADTIYSTGGTYTYRTNTDPTQAQDPFVFGTGDGAITVNGQSRVYFNVLRQMNRPGMILYNGNLYLAFGSHGDNGPYHGWFMAFNESTFAPLGVFNTTPNLGLGGLWGGGGKPAIDSNGNFYLEVANGGCDAYNNSGVAAGLNSLGFPVNGDYGDSFVKLAVDPTTSSGNQNINGWGFKVVDYFTPFNNQNLDSTDTDLGSGECTLLPASAGSSAHPNLMVGAGKQGNVYLIDCNNMGKFNATTDNVVQSQTAIGECFSTPDYFNGQIYYAADYDAGKAFTVSNASMSTTPTQSPDAFAWPGDSTTVSASGTNNGIVWAVEHSTSQLRAYLASNVHTELYTSAQAPNNRDALGTAEKFAEPTVADGLVFVGTTNALVVYGLTSTAIAPPAAPTGLTAVAVSSLQINLNWTDNSNNENGFAIEQSSDGVNFTQIATVGVNITNYQVISNLVAGTTYYFRVRAYNNYQTLSYSAYTNVASATTTLVPPTLNFPSGFAGSNTLLQYNSSAAIVNNAAELINGGQNETGTVWSFATQNIQKFSTQFTFQITNPNADGFTFAIQNNSPTAVGKYGGGLAYAGINNSICVKFDLYNNNGEGSNSTGLFTNGANPYTPATDLTSSGINLHSGDIFNVLITYDGTTLTETITDTVTKATKTLTYAINIPTTIGSNTAYVGFTAGDGTQTSTVSILTWSYAPLPTTIPAAPTNLVATPASGTQINLTWTDNSTNESGFIIQRSTSATGPFVQIAVVGAGVTTYSDTALSTGTYYYQVAATNSVGTSAFTNVATATTPVAPVTPTGAQPVTITTTSISMTWTNNATNATGINVYHRLTTVAGGNFSLVATLPPTQNTYTDMGLTPGTSYDYHIQAFNLAGYSDFSGFTASTLSAQTQPIVSVTATGPVAVNGLTSGQFTFTLNSALTADLPITYTISGTAVGGTDYTTLTGAATISAGTTSVNVPVAALPGGTTNSFVTVTLASTSTYLAGTPATATVVIESPAYNSTAQTTYGPNSVAGTMGGTVMLSFPGLPGSPSGAVYVWYLNGTAFTTTNAPVYTITNAITSQSGTYSVYAWAPGTGGTNSIITGNDTWNVTITNAPIVITTSVPSLVVNDGSTGSFTVSLATAPVANVTVNVAISGTPDLTVTPPTITMTPTNYQNQTVAVSAAAINSNDSNRSATVSLTAGTSSASVAVSDVISDTQTAANLTATAQPLYGTSIGTGSAGDASVHASGNWWIDGSGTAGLSGTADSFNFESLPFTGNFQMVVQLQNLVATGATTPLAGLMVRDGIGAGANFIALAGTTATSGGYSLISRTTASSATTTTVTSGANMTYTYPAAWMMLSRVGNVLHAFVSSNGTTYTEVTNPTTGITWTGMGNALDIGVFSSSGSAANARAVMSNFSVTTTSAAALTDADIGSPGVAGAASFNNGTYTVNGGGADIWNTADQFNYDSETVTGNSTMIVQVDSMQNTSSWAKAGIMFRDSTAAGDQYVGLYENPNLQVELQWRDVNGANAISTVNPTGDTVNPKWLELVKNGSTFTAYYATTTWAPATTDWILLATHTTAFTNVNYLAGLAVTAHNNSVVCTSVFSNFYVSNGTTQTSGSTPPPPPPPSNYTDVDIGSPPIAGSATSSGTTTTVSGCGNDIWGASDQFNYCYETNTTNKTIIVQVASIQNTNAWAKAGVMFRNSTAPGDMYVGLYENPNLQVELQWRDQANANAISTVNQTGDMVTPKWLELVKNGNTFTAYYATTTGVPTAANWILLATHSTVFSSGTYLGGLAVCSHNTAQLNTSVFSNLTQQ
jgi:hypothetical protein